MKRRSGAQPTQAESPSRDVRRRAALLCSPERGQKSALDVLAYCGFEIAEQEDADLIFMDAAEAPIRRETNASKQVLVFGVDRNMQTRTAQS